MSMDDKSNNPIQVSSSDRDPLTILKETLSKLLKILRNFLLCIGIAVSLFLATSILSAAKEENEYHLFLWLVGCLPCFRTYPELYCYDKDLARHKIKKASHCRDHMFSSVYYFDPPGSF